MPPAARMTRNGSPRIGLVGLGYWGPNLLRALMEHDDGAVVSICDLDTTRLGRFAPRYPQARATTSVDDLLDDPALDAIVIATPVHTHHAIAAKSLLAGKHTLVEKPLARSTAEADELIELA